MGRVVMIHGRVSDVKPDTRPNHNRETVVWEDTLKNAGSDDSSENDDSSSENDDSSEDYNTIQNMGVADWALGDRVVVDGRVGVVKRDMRPSHNRATVVWEDTGEEQKRVDASTIQKLDAQTAEAQKTKQPSTQTDGDQSHKRKKGAPEGAAAAEVVPRVDDSGNGRAHDSGSGTELMSGEHWSEGRVREEMRGVMEHRKMTQEEVASETGFTKLQISHFLAGRQNPDGVRLSVISEWVKHEASLVPIRCKLHRVMCANLMLAADIVKSIADSHPNGNASGVSRDHVNKFAKGRRIRFGDDKVEQTICEWLETQSEPREESMRPQCPHCNAHLGQFASVAAMRNHISSHTKPQAPRPDNQTRELSQLDSRNRGETVAAHSSRIKRVKPFNHTEVVPHKSRGRLWDHQNLGWAESRQDEGKRRKLSDESYRYRCDVCEREHQAMDGALNDDWRFCQCGVQVHTDCYCGGATDHQKASTTEWVCEVCKAGLRQEACCKICGGAMKRAQDDENSWVHVRCLVMRISPAVEECAAMAIQDCGRGDLEGDYDHPLPHHNFELASRAWRMGTLTDDEYNRLAQELKCNPPRAQDGSIFRRVSSKSKESYVSEEVWGEFDDRWYRGHVIAQTKRLLRVEFYDDQTVENYTLTTAANEVWLVRQHGFDLTVFEAANNDTIEELSARLGAPESVLLELNLPRYPSLTRRAQLMTGTQLLIPATDIRELCKRYNFKERVSANTTSFRKRHTPPVNQSRVEPLPIICNGTAATLYASDDTVYVVTADGRELAPGRFEHEVGSNAKNWRKSFRVQGTGEQAGTYLYERGIEPPKGIRPTNQVTDPTGSTKLVPTAVQETKQKYPLKRSAATTAYTTRIRPLNPPIEPLPIICNGTAATLYASDDTVYVVTADGRELAPARFEHEAGSMAKNWRKSFKVQSTGEQAGTYLYERGIEPPKGIRPTNQVTDPTGSTKLVPTAVQETKRSAATAGELCAEDVATIERLTKDNQIQERKLADMTAKNEAQSRALMDLEDKNKSLSLLLRSHGHCGIEGCVHKVLEALQGQVSQEKFALVSDVLVQANLLAVEPPQKCDHPEVPQPKPNCAEHGCNGEAA